GFPKPSPAMTAALIWAENARRVLSRTQASTLVLASSKSSLVAHRMYLKLSGLSSISPRPEPSCWVGLLAKQLDWHAQAAASKVSLSTKNFIELDEIEMLRISPVMSVTSTRQDRISEDCSGANINPWLPNENDDNALR